MLHLQLLTILGLEGPLKRSCCILSNTGQSSHKTEISIKIKSLNLARVEEDTEMGLERTSQVTPSAKP